MTKGTTPNTPKGVKKATKAKKVSVASADSTHTVILDRIAAIEKKQKILVDGLRWIAAQIKPAYGIGGVSVYFDAVADKLDK